MRYFTYILLLGLICCKQHSLIVLPKNLDESIRYFETKWSSAEKKDFLDDSLKNVHFSIGLWIRNSWIYGQRDTLLVKYFNDLGIHHPDDISSIILTSLYRTLRKEPIDLDNQIKVYRDYWKTIEDCVKKQKSIANANYSKFGIGDKIQILMPVDTSDGQKNAVEYACPYDDWTFNPNVDLEITAIIKEKFFINDSSNVFFKVKIIELNQTNINIFMQNAVIDSVYDFSLTGLTIKH